MTIRSGPLQRTRAGGTEHGPHFDRGQPADPALVRQQGGEGARDACRTAGPLSVQSVGSEDGGRGQSSGPVARCGSDSCWRHSFVAELGQHAEGDGANFRIAIVERSRQAIDHRQKDLSGDGQVSGLRETSGYEAAKSEPLALSVQSFERFPAFFARSGEPVAQKLGELAGMRAASGVRSARPGAWARGGHRYPGDFRKTASRRQGALPLLPK